MQRAGITEVTGKRAGAAIKFEGIHKRYGSSVAIERLDLDVQQGEFISLLGPSGSGKSTLLMMLAGFEQVSGGRILIDDCDVTLLPPERRGIGMVFQNYALFPHMTVAENIGFSLRQTRTSKAVIRDKVSKMLDLVQLSGFENRYPQQLSGGQQQRVAIARAVVFDPPVLLMDEPLSALDKQLREAMQLEIKSLHERLGITFIYVTHDQREALVMSDRVALLNDGKIEQIGSPRDLYDRPCSRFAASFIGEANFLGVEVVGAAAAGYYDVRMFDRTFTARGGDGSRRGPAQCVLRPEKIHLTAASDALDATGGQLEGTVTSALFLGESLRYSVEVDGCSLTVSQPHRSGTQTLAPGELARLHWAVDDFLLVV
ncbi:ABC transporter ATP-binding protein [Halotalea alkalilenta]|uniref:ABC transporter ATP-binding protein n=1 Tax=Halotalea alkalilenta TaxID=376489 RepID=UPI000693C74A|nr:ABC transporter ATP-binding protein [Halotalea alkalilenta]